MYLRKRFHFHENVRSSWVAREPSHSFLLSRHSKVSFDLSTMSLFDLGKSRVSLGLLAILVAFSLYIVGHDGGHYTPRQKHGRSLSVDYYLHDFTSAGSNNSSIFPRQSGDGTCAPGRPCVNGACCSTSGFCGYGKLLWLSAGSDLAVHDVYIIKRVELTSIGSEFCGDSCISNCDAIAECGQFAVPSGKTCPLNVWYAAFLQ